MLNQTITASGTIGWSVQSGPILSDGSLAMCEWRVFTPAGGAWGYADTMDEAKQYARDEYTRLTGEES